MVLTLHFYKRDTYDNYVYKMNDILYVNYLINL